MIDWKQHIKTDQEIHHGTPCIAGTRIPVAIILGSLADGMTAEEIISEYPQLKLDDIQAALAYASEVVTQETFLLHA